MRPFSPELFKLAREAKGFSQKELAETLTIAQSEISKAESGKKLPSEEFLLKTAPSLGYIPEFFEQTTVAIPDAGIRHRKRSALPSKTLARIEAEAVARMLDVGVFLAEREERPEKVPVREGRSPAAMARVLREKWNVPAGPIDDLSALLEAHGLLLLPFDFGTDLLDAFAIPQPNPDLPICLALNVNPSFAPDRRRFTLAHELGHVVLHREEIDDESAAKRQEKEANEFASEFLAPAADIGSELAPPLTFSCLRELKTRWKMSMSSLLYRAGELGCLSKREKDRMWYLFAKYGYRKHEPPMGLEQERPQGLVRLVAQFVHNHGGDAPKGLLLTASHFANRYSEMVRREFPMP